MFIDAYCARKIVKYEIRLICIYVYLIYKNTHNGEAEKMH